MFKEALKKAYKVKNMTQQSIADTLGVKREYINQKFQNRNMTEKSILALCDAIGCEVFVRVYDENNNPIDFKVAND